MVSHALVGGCHFLPHALNFPRSVNNEWLASSVKSDTLQKGKDYNARNIFTFNLEILETYNPRLLSSNALFRGIFDRFYFFSFEKDCAERYASQGQTPRRDSIDCS